VSQILGMWACTLFVHVPSAISQSDASHIPVPSNIGGKASLLMEVHPPSQPELHNVGGLLKNFKSNNRALRQKKFFFSHVKHSSNSGSLLSFLVNIINYTFPYGCLILLIDNFLHVIHVTYGYGLDVFLSKSLLSLVYTTEMRSNC